jgi:hypothetical protein
MKSGSFDYIHYHSFARTGITEKRLNAKFLVISSEVVP